MGKPVKVKKNNYNSINIIAVIACLGVIVVILTVLFASYILDKTQDPPTTSGCRAFVWKYR